MVIFKKNIFQIWFQGYNNITNPEFKTNIRNWKEMNSEWNYKCLDEYDLERLCQEYGKKCYEAYKKTHNMHTKIDLGRMVVMYLRGGIFVDMDMFAFRPLRYSKELNDLINSKKANILGLSKIYTHPLENLIAYQIYELYNNAVIISSKGNLILKKLIDEYIKNIIRTPNSKHMIDYMYVNQTTGPKAFNKIIQPLINNIDKTKHDIKIFDYTVFEPCELNGKCNINKNTISIHRFEMSWMPKWGKELIIIYDSIKRPVVIMIIISILNKLLEK